MSKVVVFGDDLDVVDDLGGGSNRRHKETEQENEGKSSEQPIARTVSFDPTNLRESRNNSAKQLVSRKNSGGQLLVQTQSSLRNFQLSLDEYSGGSPKNNSKEVSASAITIASARRESQRGGADEIVIKGNMHRQKSVMGPKTAFEMNAVNDELSEGMSCGGEHNTSSLTMLLFNTHYLATYTLLLHHNNTFS